MESIVSKYIDLIEEMFKINPFSSFLMISVLLPVLVVSIPVDLIRFIIIKLSSK